MQESLNVVQLAILLALASAGSLPGVRNYFGRWPLST